MTLSQLRYAITVADSRSMNQAAQKLFISQPSLSAAIRELEDEVGIEIFRRTNRGIQVTPDGEEFRKSGSGCDPEGVKIRNVAGEMLGAMNAVQWAKEHEYPAVEIRYDYEGVEKWVTGVWRAKTPLTSKYAAHMQEAAEQIKISFCKVAAHTGNHYNEEADQLAKSALLRTDENVSI